jgi:hypothetical protein
VWDTGKAYGRFEVVVALIENCLGELCGVGGDARVVPGPTDNFGPKLFRVPRPIIIDHRHTASLSLQIATMA